jgi:hypothetical protein
MSQYFNNLNFFDVATKLFKKKCKKVQFFAMGILNKAQWFEILAQYTVIAFSK